MAIWSDLNWLLLDWLKAKNFTWEKELHEYVKDYCLRSISRFVRFDWEDFRAEQWAQLGFISINKVIVQSMTNLNLIALTIDCFVFSFRWKGNSNIDLMTLTDLFVQQRISWCWTGKMILIQFNRLCINWDNLIVKRAFIDFIMC